MRDWELGAGDCEAPLLRRARETRCLLLLDMAAAFHNRDWLRWGGCGG